MIGVSVALFGRVLGTAFASGLNLYAAVATLGLASRLGWIEPLPVPLRGLESSLVIASAAALYLVDFAADKIRHIGSVWDAIHTFVRPTGAALLALGMLAGQPATTTVIGVVAAGVTALLAHGARAGRRLSLGTADAPRAAALAGVVQDILAIALPILAFRRPDLALFATLVAIAAVALLARPLWRAFILGSRAFAARVRGFFRRSHWHDVDSVPPSLRAQIDPPQLGRAPHRAARAALRGLPTAGTYRNGWLVVTPDETIFVYRSLFRARRTTLPSVRATRVHRGLWADRVDVDAEDGARFVLFLLKDGPPADRAVAALAPMIS